MKKDLQKSKKIKKFLLPASIFILTLLAFAFVLIAHRPARYSPVKITDQNQISPYLTKQLMPKIYNGAQLGQSFEVVITQDGLNDIIARRRQPVKLRNITLADPQVILLPEQIILMAAVKTSPLDLFASIELNPSIDQRGLMNLHINNVSLGAVNVTPVALSIGNKAFSNWLVSTGTEPNNIIAQICRSLLSDEPFEPTFEIGGKMLRITSIKLADKKITCLLIPVPDQPDHIQGKTQTAGQSQPTSAR